MGFFGHPAIYMSGMQVSDILSESKALSGQLSVFTEKARTPALAIGKQGYRHHVAVGFGATAVPVREALETYLGYEFVTLAGPAS